MCRWLAYLGPPLRIDELLFKPANSLIRQSLSARQSISTTNGDGFGLGWYGERPHPGLFRDTLPAWNDANLLSLSEQIRSSLFFAHVRASTGTSTSRENCHPFRFNRTLFMHNGRIGGWDQLRRDIERLIPTELYGERLGTTDSEAFFLLAVANGLSSDPANAITQSINQVLELMREANITDPFRMTVAIADGVNIVSARYSSDHQSPSLFFTTGGQIMVDDGQISMRDGDGATLVLSEPLDEDTGLWREIPEAHLLIAGPEGHEITPLAVS